MTWERIGEEFGFAGVTARGRLRGTDAPASVVAKLPAAQEAGEREARFYRTVGSPFAPRLLGLRDGVLLLEDVHGRQGDVVEGCSAADAASALSAAADLHVRGRAVGGFPVWGGDPAARQERHAARVEAFLAAHELPGRAAAVVRALGTRLASVVAELQAGGQTLIHGDLHVDNMLFADDGRVVVLDWESVSVGPPAWDAAMLLFGSLRVEERRAAEHELFVGYAAVTGVDLEALRRSCALALLVLVAGAIGWLSAPERDGAGVRERLVRSRAFGDGRLVAALEDHASVVL